MKIRIFCVCWTLGFGLWLPALGAADTNPPPASGFGSGLPIADMLGFARGLQIDPKIITSPEKGGTTVGLEYNYNREIKRTVLHQETDLGFSLRSGGLVVADESKVPNHVFTHGLRLSVIDLLPTRVDKSSPVWAHHTALTRRIDQKYYFPWTDLASAENPTAADRDRMAELFDQASRELQDYGKLEADEEAAFWYLRDSSGQRTEVTRALTEQFVKERVLFLAFDVDGDVEHDQSFTNVQFVGSAQLRGKLMVPFLDFPFEMLRGGGPAKNWLNRNGGPHFWGGVGIVDASDNDTRNALTSNHERFARAHFGISYRTEIFSISESRSVALELQWRYYYEFSAPAAIRARDLDHTSYFKATILFPGNYFVEYADGKLPLDVEGASTVSVGWRYNF